MKEIVKIWFDGDMLYGESNSGEIYRQSLLWYPGLLNASDEARNKYEFGLDGIHWRLLDEDVSFESFFYEDAMPSTLQKFFLTHPEISIAGFSKRIGMSASLLRNYIHGFQKPSKESENQILNQIRSLGQEMTLLQLG